ncbi:MAG: ATP-binding cassette domain-containing protein [Propionibacteriaceae bacterium]|nr:ATP-binding cassette domain-containing protein [Propionibacteriaceae bacterium]
MPGAPTIAVMHVSKSYRTDGQTVVALPDTSLVADAGEVVWLHGESGVGKTTLLNIVGLLTSADTGDVELCGSPIRWTSASAMARLRRELIGFVFQTHNLVGWLDPLDNVLLAGGRVASTRAGELLADLGLAGRLHVQARRLSGGANSSEPPLCAPSSTDRRSCWQMSPFQGWTTRWLDACSARWRVSRNRVPAWWLHLIRRWLVATALGKSS